ncbi:hypothetical protein KAI87_17370, partial [Myxococcota bacterium]|nr:hypothetical protein [Myxococcota bacterium]
GELINHLADLWAPLADNSFSAPSLTRALEALQKNSAPHAKLLTVQSEHLVVDPLARFVKGMDSASMKSQRDEVFKEVVGTLLKLLEGLLEEIADQFQTPAGKTSWRETYRVFIDEISKILLESTS